MTLHNIESSIYSVINEFRFLKGHYPERIFISRPLFEFLKTEYIKRYAVTEQFVYEDNPFAVVYGVRIQVYEGDEPEFYLGSFGGRFRE